MTRRIAILFLLLTAHFAGATGQKQDYKTVQVAENITAFVANESATGVVQGNIVLIVGEDSALIVDSGQFPSLAWRIAGEIKRITDKPVRVLVNTHWHGDHLLANHVFLEAFPGMTVLQHQETRKMADKYYADWDQKKMGFSKLVETIRERLKSGKHSDGTPITPEEAEGYAADTDALEVMMPDIVASSYTPCNETYAGEVSFYLGKREVRVMNLGWGNTAGDSLVFVPDVNVLITGDTVVYPTPYSFGSFHGSWIEVLNKMIAMNPAVVVPGHGPVMRDLEYLKALVSLLEDTRAEVKACVAEKLSLEETRKRVTLPAWRKRLAGEDRGRQRAFREFYLQPGIEMAYKEATGQKLEE